jgi:hypothetical protein
MCLRRDGIAPYAYVALPNLAPGQRYNIAIDLILPCTEPNTNLGNFMTTLTLSAPNNKTLAYVRRSVSTIVLYLPNSKVIDS